MPIVTIHPTGEEIWLEPGETILTGLYTAGYAYTVGCRRGGCGICKVDARSGDFSYTRPIADSVLTEEERHDGTCLSCRAVPESDMAIEMREGSIRLVNGLLRTINDRARKRAQSPDASPNSGPGTSSTPNHQPQAGTAARAGRARS